MSSKLKRSDIYDLNQLLVELYQEKDKRKAVNLFLDKLKNIIFFDKANIYLYKNFGTDVEFHNFIHVGWNEYEREEHIDRYLDNYTLDDTLDIISQNKPVIIRTSDCFINLEREKTEYYNEVLKPSNIHFSLEGNFDVLHEDFTGGISIHRSKLHKDFSDRDVELIKLLRPHLSNISKELLESRLSFAEYHKIKSSFFDKVNNLALFILDINDLKLIKTNAYDVPFIPNGHVEELISAVKRVCRDLKRQYGARLACGLHQKMQISIFEKAYFIEIIANTESDESSKIAAAVYDFANIYEIVTLDYCKRFSLTKRESEIFQFMIKGLSSKEIADKLFISIPTVKSHLNSIYQKFGIDGKYGIYNFILGEPVSLLKPVIKD